MLKGSVQHSEGALNYPRLKLCAGWLENGAGVKLNVYFASEAVKGKRLGENRERWVEEEGD